MTLVAEIRRRGHPTRTEQVHERWVRRFDVAREKLQGPALVGRLPGMEACGIAGGEENGVTEIGMSEARIFHLINTFL